MPMCFVCELGCFFCSAAAEYAIDADPIDSRWLFLMLQIDKRSQTIRIVVVSKNQHQESS